jgi:DNA-binding response OmpR family regulator
MAVVIVDDSATNLIVLKHLSAALHSFDIVTFSDAKAALDYLTKQASELIIVDFAMPQMNGIEFITMVRQQPHHVETPIVMVTQMSDRDIRMRALEAGATDFLNKPVDPSEYKARLRNLLKFQGAIPHKSAASQSA